MRCVCSARWRTCVRAMRVTYVLADCSSPRVSVEDDWDGADALVVAPGGCVVKLPFAGLLVDDFLLTAGRLPIFSQLNLPYIFQKKRMNEGSWNECNFLR